MSWTSTTTGKTATTDAFIAGELLFRKNPPRGFAIFSFFLIYIS